MKPQAHIESAQREAPKTNLPESIAPGETLASVQLCPFGEFPNGKSMQLCDETAFNKLVEAFHAAGAKEVLCDFEHKSEDPVVQITHLENMPLIGVWGGCEEMSR